MSEEIVCISSSDDEDISETKRKYTDAKQDTNGDVPVIDLTADTDETIVHQVKIPKIEIPLYTVSKIEELPAAQCHYPDVDNVALYTPDPSSGLPSDYDTVVSAEARRFLSVCASQLGKGDGKVDLITQVDQCLYKSFKKMSPDFSNSEYLRNFLNQHTERAVTSKSACTNSLIEVSRHMKECSRWEDQDIPKRQKKRIKKLEKAIEDILGVLKKLEEEIVDFDVPEHETSYIRQDMYSKRLVKLFRIYCRIFGENPHSGCLTFQRLDFVSSNYTDINLAINEKFKNCRKFPDYQQVYEVVREVIVQKKLPLNNQQTDAESFRCFKKLGGIIQTRRKIDLYQRQCCFITEKDPAAHDKTLDDKLSENARIGNANLERILEEYTRRQEMQSSDEKSEC